MKIGLGRPVEMSAYHVVMEIGRAEKRRDILAVLMLADELGGTVTPEDICNHLLVDRPVALGRTIIARCRALELLDESGRLTQTGQEALRRGRIFQSERGRYRVLCTLDPLVPQLLLSIDEVQEPDPRLAVRERKRARDSKEGRPLPDDVPVPAWLTDVEGRTITLARNGEEVRILRIEPRCVKDTLKGEKLAIRWTLYPDKDATLELDGFAHRELEPPALSHEEVLLQIHPELRTNWDPEVGILRVSFDGLKDAERSSFRRVLRVEQPAIGDFGSFDATEIRDIPLAPRTRADAQQWAEWTLDRSITGYLGRREYEDLTRRVAGYFPEYPPTLPPQEQKAGALRQVLGPKPEPLPRTYWFLQAPIDLDMPEAST